MLRLFVLKILLLAFCVGALSEPAVAGFCEKAFKKIERVRKKPSKHYPTQSPEKVLNRMERIEARLQARSEQSWRTGEQIANQAEIQSGLASGRLVIAEDRPGIGISSKMAIKVSTPTLDRAMDAIAQDFKLALQAEGFDTARTKLVITSIVRTTELQNQLIAQGYPASARSSHTYGISFDISYRWFEENAPRQAEILRAVLKGHEAYKHINLIREERQGVWHVTLSPEFQESLGGHGGRRNDEN